MDALRFKDRTKKNLHVFSTKNFASTAILNYMCRTYFL